MFRREVQASEATQWRSSNTTLPTFCTLEPRPSVLPFCACATHQLTTQECKPDTLHCVTWQMCTGMKGVVFSAFLFAATVVLFPYVGMLLTVTCRGESLQKPVRIHSLAPTVHSDSLGIGEKNVYKLVDVYKLCLVISV